MTKLQGRLLLFTVGALSFAAVTERASNQTSIAGPRLRVWHGETQKVGHLGDAQDDFNLLGYVENPGNLRSLTYSLNDGSPVALTFNAYRRLAADGDFNADIPIRLLRNGRNTITLRAEDKDANVSTETVILNRKKGSYPLPVTIHWPQVKDPQDVGQYVDGQWAIENSGLRVLRRGYDRVFLIGERDWQDYEVTARVTINAIQETTSPQSGGNGLGILLRFAGHVVGGPRDFPDAQPKWGYQPFGAIGWLRWQKEKPDAPPQKQFYRGDNDGSTDHGKFPVTKGATYVMKFACETLQYDKPTGIGVTRYSFKIWPDGGREPGSWDWQETQRSEHSLRRGGAALLAHHVDATFGDIIIVEVNQGKESPR